MGIVAAADIAAALRRHLLEKDTVRMIFAAARSQQETLAALAVQPGIDWSRVTAFHMDEYVGLAEGAPQRFASWLQQAIFNCLPFAHVHLIQPGADPVASAKTYAALLAEAPIDLICLGIGVNGHLAFNDPHVADFNDPDAVKIVTLDDVCRQQQVDDGCFATLADVPTQAITLTIPRLLDAAELFCVVPGAAKLNAVRNALYAPINAINPATSLRTHANCTLYLDRDSTPEALALA
ncbi:glucosamine-6-phosphate deaminase [Glaciimonas sp. PCH181]|nr:glucosamine-6-phosphate deaminase [Glaciimonas sp. PCH181]